LNEVLLLKGSIFFPGSIYERCK